MGATRLVLRPASLYVAIVAVLGLGLLTHSAVRVADGSAGFHWLAVAALAFLSRPCSIRVPGVTGSISIAEAFLLSTILLFGVAPATVVAAIDAGLASLFPGQRGRKRRHGLLEVTEPAVAVWISGTLFFSLAATEPLAVQSVGLTQIGLPLVALVTAYFVSTSVLSGLARARDGAGTPAEMIAQLPARALDYVVSLGLTALVAINADHISFAAVGVILPILLMSYVTSRTSTARVEDAHRHLADLNKLYLSTVETLAMAVDAKDQVTHGHIRRVQQRAVRLARTLGIDDELEIRALEAAALLHDLGKLAIPEHILNKPGKLTAAEYEHMKRHAGIGADILSMVSFPYPVVPVVRHHHENWDGSGYPDGLSGNDIPIGARILSVVDCFDALTSDRPYRRRLTDAEAIAILDERRGTMYDPRVVDAFVATQAHQHPDEVEEAHRASTPRERQPRPAVERAASERGSDAGTVEPELVGRLRRWVEVAAPDAVAVVYRYDVASDALVATSVTDQRYGFVLGLRIPLGERLAGWVAANRQTIVNSDPALDLGDTIPDGVPRLRSCLSVALADGPSLLGVLALYDAAEGAFTAQQVQLLELAARRVGRSADACSPMVEPVLPGVLTVGQGSATP